MNALLILVALAAGAALGGCVTLLILDRRKAAPAKGASLPSYDELKNRAMYREHQEKAQ